MLDETIVRVRGEVVFNGATQRFADGWTRSTYEATDDILNSSFDFTLRPDRSVYFRDSEIVLVEVVVSGDVVQSWSYEAKPSPIQTSTYRMILQAIRNADEAL